MADILFVLYLIFMAAVAVLCIHPKGIKLQQEFMAFDTTKKFCEKNEIRWP